MELKLMLVRQIAAIVLALPSMFQLPPAGASEPAAVAGEVPDGSEALMRKIFAEDNERRDALDPLGTLSRGETVDASALKSLFTDALDRERLLSARVSLEALTRLDRSRLSSDRQISFDVFTQTKRKVIEDLQPEIRALTGVRPFNHFGGLHIDFPTFMSSSGSIPYETESDYRRAVELNTAFATVLENAELRFREGMATGIVEPKLTIRHMIGQLDALLAQPVTQSPFYSPLENFPDTIPSGVRSDFRAAFGAVIRTKINPAYQRLRDFLALEYLPAARDEIGLSAMKGGRGLYRRLIRRETTLDLAPDEVSRLGKEEVRRIKRDMMDVKRQLEFEGSLDSFFLHIRNSPRFHPRSREQLVEGFDRIKQKVDKQVLQLFSARPKTRLSIAPYPPFRERYEPGGSYYQGSSDAKRPGIFYFNTFDLPSRFLTGMTTLYLHEAAPGHHFQISLAQENSALPSFQRRDGNNAFVEGWALYAETLGHEMGLYDDPMQHWGTLDDEMLRAMRLVVDTGIHARGWSRGRAVEYMLANSGMSRADAVAEVDRYIANPAQAISYKIGALTIQELRRKAETALGRKFDVRAFHDQVLGSGALPLPILKTKIERWIVAHE
ncbi:MAG: DUF885 domain-containing protein [Novosphingobium sp.]|nr:DUF885 domain-containing protein [Novosphingobium sp.]